MFKSRRPYPYFFLLIVLTIFPTSSFAAPTVCATLTDSDYIKCKLLELMDDKVDEIYDAQVCNESYCGHDSSTAYFNTFKGMFYEAADCPASADSDQNGYVSVNEAIYSLCVNNSKQEGLYTLAFVYKNEFSDYEGDPEVLASLNRALLFLRRAQSGASAYGKIPEHGWCGVNYSRGDAEGNPPDRKNQPNTNHA